MTTRCDVVIKGFRLNGTEPPARVLVRVLGWSEEDARARSKQFPTIVSSGLEPREAERIATALRDGGAYAMVRVTGAEPPSVEEGERVAQLPAQPSPEALASAPHAGADDAAHLAADGVEPQPEQRASRVSVYRLGTLKIVVGGPEKKQDGSYRLGTLKIQLARATESATNAAPASAKAAAESAHASPLDDPWNEAGGEALEIDETALADRSQKVQVPGRRPSLMLRVRRSLTHVPSALVRSARSGKNAARARSSSRARLWLLAAVLALFGVFAALPRGGAEQSRVAESTQAEGAASASHREVKRGDEAGSELHPLLRILPAGTRGGMAQILRARVPGTVHVLIEWPEGEAVEDPACYLVLGTAPQRRQRIEALGHTGMFFAPSTDVARQLAEHEDTQRIAQNDEHLKLERVCLRGP